MPKFSAAALLTAAALLLLLVPAMVTWAQPAMFYKGLAAAPRPRPPLLPSFLVLGQMKCGTSALWNYLMAHPDADSSRPKEPLYFGKPTPTAPAANCSRSAARYLRRFTVTFKMSVPQASEPGTSGGNASDSAAAAAPPGATPTDALTHRQVLGDFTASHLSCACCPALFKSLNPDMRLIAVLREPVVRAASRFEEQRSRDTQPFYVAASAAPDLAAMVGSEMGAMSGCLQDAAELSAVASAGSGSGGGGSGATNSSGGGGGVHRSLRALLEAQCMEPHTVGAYSAYAPFLENWLSHFPASQLLVLYSGELQQRPREVMRLVEAHLGLQPFDYPDQLLATQFNTRERRGWRAAPRGDGSAGSSGGGDGGAAGDNTNGRHAVQLGDLAAYWAWLEPYNQRLRQLASQGLIRPPPPDFFVHHNHR